MRASDSTSETGTLVMRSLTAIFLALILSSCGGGSNSNNPENPNIGNDNTTDPEAIQKVYNIRLEWEAPNERTDGEQMFLWELLGYKITYSEESGSNLATINIDSAETTEATIEGLEEGVYQFWIAAIDGENQASSQSEVLVVDLTN